MTANTWPSAPTWISRGAEWTPIGAGTRKSSGIAEGSTPFAGTFDGAGHTVSGLKITSTQGADYAIGLFGILDGATAKNLTVADTKIAVPQSGLAGILCGMLANDSTVSGVSVSGSVSGKAGVGGIAGRMTLSGTIENCENSASVTAAAAWATPAASWAPAYYTTPTGRMAITGCLQQREHFRHRLHRRHRPASARPSCRIARTAAPLPARATPVGGASSASRRTTAP